MSESNYNIHNEHSIIINNRKTISISGVTEVLSFDEQIIVVKTELGELTIKGDMLKVNRFANETGDLSLEGEFCALAYTSLSKKSISKRLFG